MTYDIGIAVMLALILSLASCAKPLFCFGCLFFRHLYTFCVKPLLAVITLDPQNTNPLLLIHTCFPGIYL